MQNKEEPETVAKPKTPVKEDKSPLEEEKEPIKLPMVPTEMTVERPVPKDRPVLQEVMKAVEVNRQK